jgi:hypothetical protein
MNIKITVLQDLTRIVRYIFIDISEELLRVISLLCPDGT